MANEQYITIRGRLTAAPELRFGQSGVAIASFTIAANARKFNRQSNEFEDKETTFWRCSAFREMAENIAESLDKGMAVVAYAELESRSFETREGEKRTVTEAKIEAIGPDLRWSTAKVTKSNRGNGGQGGTARSQVDPYNGTNSGFTPAPASNGGQGDPWGGSGSAGSWETPTSQESPF